jgi:hypothetical protein
MEVLIQILYIIIPFVIGFMTFLVKIHLNRISALESKLEHCVTKEEVNQIVNDKLAPVREDIAEIKATLTKLYDFLLTNK